MGREGRKKEGRKKKMDVGLKNTVCFLFVFVFTFQVHSNNVIISNKVSTRQQFRHF